MKNIDFGFEHSMTLYGDDLAIEVLFNPILKKDGSYDEVANKKQLNKELKAVIKRKFQPRDTSFVKHLKDFDFDVFDDEVNGKTHLITELKLKDVVIAELSAIFAKKGY